MTMEDLSQLRYLRREIRQLEERVLVSNDEDIRHLIERQLARCKAEEIVLRIYIDNIDDSYVRQILRLRFVDGLKWNEVADEVGGNTENSVRKMVERFIAE